MKTRKQTMLFGMEETVKKNKNLGIAKKKKDDEYFTRLEDIQRELKFYREHFKNKVVLCNCDDPSWSAFVKYFATNFYVLELKKLISTHYEREGSSYKLEITQQINTKKELDILPRIPLKENGDFSSEECIELLKESDIVCTNPPFSLFNKYIKMLVDYKKEFLIIGNYNAITHKEMFGLIKENKIWTGVSPRSMSFGRPDGSFEQVNATWYTNLEHKKRNKELLLYKKYEGNEDKYPKYDDYDAINIDKTKEIPKDYAGFMGVPITFLDKYNPEQFEIIDLDNEIMKEVTGKKVRFKLKGKTQYARIVIKRRQKDGN